MTQKSSKVSVELQPIGRRARATSEATLLSVAQSVGVELQAVCGGSGTCGECKVRLVAGTLSSPTPEEKAELGERALIEGLRLACQARPLSDVTLDLPADSLSSPQRVQIEGGTIRILADPRERSRPRPRDAALGLAVDLGTTKIAGYLVDLRSGETLTQQGAMNPQIVYGEDVISRIFYAGQSKEAEQRLRQKVMTALAALTEALCRKARVSKDQIAEVVVAGNTAMHHLFAGLPVRQLGLAPYRPATTAPRLRNARETGLPLGRKARLYTPPNVAGYVGGDHVAMLLGIGIAECPEPTLAIDIGTNTEVTLKARGRMWTCSCASGPAFEGAHIKHGMRAAAGAIERVRYEDGAMQYYTIDRQAPVGLCGSGIVDALAALLDAGVLDSRGNFKPGSPRVRRTKEGMEFPIAAQTGTDGGPEIVLTRQDISEIQFAKAAIRAGIEILLGEGGVQARELEQFVIAGAFGSYLGLESAVRIGLFPALPVERFRQVGNAVGLGARLMLASPARRREGERLARRLEYVELTLHPGFHKAFVNALRL